jgi:hypothetical protein
MKFLLDSNIFIEAKNRYYGFDICPGFWDWIDHVCANDVASIVEVRDELIDGRDDLADWITARNEAAWFLRVDDDATQSNFVEVADHVSNAGYTTSAVAKFLSKPILGSSPKRLHWEPQSLRTKRSPSRAQKIGL